MIKMKILPEEPTREMWEAMADAIVNMQSGGAGQSDLITKAVYEAAYKTAPQLLPMPIRKN